MRRSGVAITIRHAVSAFRTPVLRHVRHAVTSLRMPAMSPTMTEGGVAGWKKNEGETFTAGDVLLEIETDKATIDVEAQDDGVMGKIIVKAGTSKIPVGQVIAMLAEEGDDLAFIEVPKDLGPEGGSSSDPAPEPKAEAKEEKPQKEEKPKKEKSGQKEETQEKQQKAQPAELKKEGVEQQETGHGSKQIKHSKPLFPSVSRLLLESPLTSKEISKLKGTGKNGMLTKGDVLLALGQIKNAYGSAEKLNLDVMGASGRRASEAKVTAPTGGAKQEPPLDGPGLRRLILRGMSKATEPARPIVSQASSPLPLSSDADFDEMLAPYSSLLPAPQPAVNIPEHDSLAAMESEGSRRKQDEWAGLF